MRWWVCDDESTAEAKTSEKISQISASLETFLLASKVETVWPIFIAQGFLNHKKIWFSSLCSFRRFPSFTLKHSTRLFCAKKLVKLCMLRCFALHYNGSRCPKLASSRRGRSMIEALRRSSMSTKGHLDGREREGENAQTLSNYFDLELKCRRPRWWTVEQKKWRVCWLATQWTRNTQKN